MPAGNKKGSYAIHIESFLAPVNWRGHQNPVSAPIKVAGILPDVLYIIVTTCTLFLMSDAYTGLRIAHDGDILGSGQVLCCSLHMLTRLSTCLNVFEDTCYLNGIS